MANEPKMKGRPACICLHKFALTLSVLFACLAPFNAYRAVANPISHENLNPSDKNWREVVESPFGPAFDSVGYING